MENRAGLLFEGDSKARWYLAVGEQWVGPLTASDVYAKVRAQEVGFAHYIWKPGQSEWKRICDVKEFHAVVPPEPSKPLQALVKSKVEEEVTRPIHRLLPPPFSQRRGMTKEKIWFFHYNDSQFGPFSTEEVVRFLQVGKVHAQMFAWRDGMEGWELLGKIREFESVISSLKRSSKTRSLLLKAPSKSEKRQNLRRPLVARIFLSHEDKVIVAVCRDISVGGMQVLTDRIPGGPGTRLKMNVSPAGDLKTAGLQPFLADGIVVRVLEDQCGFSFRFENLPDRARRAIEGYIERVQ